MNSHLLIQDENYIQLDPNTPNPFDMEYLYPPDEAQNIMHPSDYIFKDNGKGKPIRRIFYNQEFTPFECEQVNKLYEKLKEEKVVLPKGWTDLKTLKYIHNEQFNFKSAVALIKKHIIWLADPALQNPSQDNIDKYLKKGVIYTFGRDKLFRPIVVINAHQIKVNNESVSDMNGVNGALCRLLSIVQKNMFVEGKIENWIIFIDTNSIGVLELDFKAIGKIVECMVANYTCILHKLFLLNPSWIFRQSWKIISAFIPADTQEKIEFLTKEEFNRFQTLGIERDQLEQRFGGTAGPIEQFWPPINTYPKAGHRQRLSVPFHQESSQFLSMIDNSHFHSRMSIFSGKEEQQEGKQPRILEKDTQQVYRDELQQQQKLTQKRQLSYARNQYSSNHKNVSSSASFHLASQDNIQHSPPSSSCCCNSSSSCIIF